MPHTKPCLSAALINAIENLRDDDMLTVEEFEHVVGTRVPLTLAEEYLEIEMLACRCPVPDPIQPVTTLMGDGITYRIEWPETVHALDECLWWENQYQAWARIDCSGRLARVHMDVDGEPHTNGMICEAHVNAYPDYLTKTTPD